MQEMQFDITLKKWGRCNVSIRGFYQDNTNVMTIRSNELGPIARMSVFVEGAKEHIGPDEILIKGWSENAEIYREMVEQGILIPVGRRIPTGFVSAVVCKVKVPGEKHAFEDNLDKSTSIKYCKVCGKQNIHPNHTDKQVP